MMNEIGANESVEALPLLVVFILGFMDTFEQADHAAQKFGQQSEFHNVAITHYRNCNRTILDSKEQCIAESIQIAEQSGANDSVQLVNDLVNFTNKPKPTFLSLMKSGLFYFVSKE